jgi:hypothetical protein
MSTLTQLSALDARVCRAAAVVAMIVAVIAAMILLAGCGTGGAGSASPARAGGPVPVISVPAPATTAPGSVMPGGAGSVTGLVFHPTPANVLYARTDVGGAYRWDPTTMSWTAIADGVGLDAARRRFHGIASIALDLNDDQPVYIATGRYTFEADGRIYVSNDRGRTWTHVDLPSTPSLGAHTAGL